MPAWDDMALTPSLAEYRKMEEKDSNLFWRLDCGHHQNLLDEAIDLLDEANDKLALMEEENGR